eukprot:13709-Pleurochrysis_carterae.AAC.1
MLQVGAPPTAIVDLVEERVMWWEAEAVEGRSRPQRGAARTFRVSPLSRDAETASAAESVDASAPQVDAARVRLLRDELIERVVELEEEESELSELYLNEMQAMHACTTNPLTRHTLRAARLRDEALRSLNTHRPGNNDVVESCASALPAVCNIERAASVSASPTFDVLTTFAISFEPRARYTGACLGAPCVDPAADFVWRGGANALRYLAPRHWR